MAVYNKYSSLHFAKHCYDYERPILEFRVGLSMKEREEWKQKITAKMKELMKFPENMYETPVVNLLLSRQRDTYRIEKYEISTEPNLWATFLVLIPNEASYDHKLPGVLCCPGTAWEKEHLCGEDFCDLEYEETPARDRPARSKHGLNTMALQYCRSGMVAIACEDMGVGEQASDDVKASDVDQLLLGQGRHMMGITVEMRLGLLKWMKEQPFVDRERLAVSGHSLGVNSALRVALLDEDVKAFVYNDCLIRWREMVSAICPPDSIGISYWQMYPEGWKWFEEADLLAAYAPRKLFITEGGRTEHLEKLAKVYDEYGASGNFRYDYYREYRDPANRKYDYVPHKKGMTASEMYEYSNVVPLKHYFKGETAVPWLVDALK